MNNWPPPYRIKRHAKAKNVILKTVADKGLIVTVPKRYSIKHVPNILETHKDWILTQLATLAPLPTSIDLPTAITLNAQQITWTIHYYSIPKRLKILERPQHELVLIGDISDKKQCFAAIITWLKQQAKLFLLSELAQLSLAINLPYVQAQVRDQATVWGSCTHKKTISLNYRLILLPPMLVRYVLVHELCHTVHLNHSFAFWALVARFDPDWQAHKQALKTIAKTLPNWL